jgi:hypothetical protein
MLSSLNTNDSIKGNNAKIRAVGENSTKNQLNGEENRKLFRMRTRIPTGKTIPAVLGFLKSNDRKSKNIHIRIGIKSSFLSGGIESPTCNPTTAETKPIKKKSV